MLTYQQSLAFIHSIARFGSKPGLRRVTMLLERMGNPQNGLKFVHVAGTNGKGSTCTMLSHILTQAGYRTGLYISPFVLDFRERIQLDNQMISQEDLAASTTLVKSHWDVLDAMGETPTEFEVVVAIAMDYFVRQGCQVVVLEVGMGGRFDATNVIETPLVSVITSIGIDHTEYLGDTMEQIAMEKSGIIKENGITVSYPQQDPAALAVIMERCAVMNNQLHMGNSAEVLAQDLFGTDIRYGERELHIPLPGGHQVHNTITVVETAEALRLRGFAISDDHIREGIAATTFPSRLEVLRREPLILLDGAHNLAGAQALADFLQLTHGRRVHLVMGMLADKEVDGSLAVILPHCHSLTAVTPDNPRAMPAHELAERARPYCQQVTASATVQQGVADALALCQGDDILLGCGSLYLASQLRPLLLEASNSPH